MISSVV